MTLIVKNVKPEDENIFPYAAITSTANQIISQLYRIIVFPSKSMAFPSLLPLSDKELECFCFLSFSFELVTSLTIQLGMEMQHALF